MSAVFDKVKRNRAKVVKWVIIVVVTAVIAVSAYYLVINTVLPAMAYRNAEQMREEGKYEDAAAAFSELGEFRDAQLQLTETYYLQAKDLAAKGEYTRAAFILLSISDYRDAEYMIKTTPELVAAAAEVQELDSRFAVGNYVTLGRYCQTDENEPIQWLVLARDGHKALLLSRYALDCRQYHGAYSNTRWQDCALRSWLNDAFYNTEFALEEKEQIIITRVDNSSAQSYFDTEDEPDTLDRLFLLSYHEAWTYLPGEEKRKCEPTDYAKEQNAYVAKNGCCRWWLRSAASSQASVCSIDEKGKRSSGYVHESKKAVRPAMWIDIAVQTGNSNGKQGE